MSVQMMGAVINSGPQDRTQFCVMITLANYADDFGFAYPSIETIATNSRCDVRTARRQIMVLEADGWLFCARKAVNGKSNAYILNVARMGVRVPSEARRSPLFLRLCKTYGDTMTPIFAPEKSEDIALISEDKSQPLTGQDEQTQRTFGKSQRTFEGGSEDIACPPNLKNHSTYLNRQNRQEPKDSIEPSTPLPPEIGGSEFFQIAAEADEPKNGSGETLVNLVLAQGQGKNLPNEGQEQSNGGNGIAALEAKHRRIAEALAKATPADKLDAQLLIATAQTMRTRGYTPDRRMEETISEQFRLWCSKTKGTPAEAAALGAKNYNDWMEHKHLMRHPWGRTWWFRRGYWARPQEWPWDQKLVRMSREAAIGKGP